MVKYEEVVLDNNILKIANKIVRKYQNLLNEEELEQCKQIGIWQACTKYTVNNKNNCKLSTYIAHHIRWECGRLIEVNKRYKLKNSNNLEQLIDKRKDLSEYESFSSFDEDSLLLKRFQYKYTLKEISEETGMSIVQISRKLNRIISRLKQDLS